MRQNKWSEHLDFESCLALPSLGLPLVQIMGVYIIPVFYDMYGLTNNKQGKMFSGVSQWRCLQEEISPLISKLRVDWAVGRLCQTRFKAGKRICRRKQLDWETNGLHCLMRGNQKQVVAINVGLTRIDRRHMRKGTWRDGYCRCSSVFVAQNRLWMT